MISASVVEPDRPMITDSFDSAGKYNVSYQPQIPSGLFRTQAVYKPGPGKWVDPGSVGQSTRTLVGAWLGAWLVPWGWSVMILPRSPPTYNLEPEAMLEERSQKLSWDLRVSGLGDDDWGEEE